MGDLGGWAPLRGSSSVGILRGSGRCGTPLSGPVVLFVGRGPQLRWVQCSGEVWGLQGPQSVQEVRSVGGCPLLRWVQSARRVELVMGDGSIGEGSLVSPETSSR